MRARRVLLHLINTTLMAHLAVAAYMIPELYLAPFGRWRIVVLMLCSAAWGASVLSLVDSIRMQRHLTRISRARFARKADK